ncbi:MAG: hypothetical protein IT360_23795 [Gemmatimonadaceae bacterium]|nr:hypothetical protein [Gemmatimonadaceae bacterium]
MRLQLTLNVRQHADFYAFDMQINLPAHCGTCGLRFPSGFVVSSNVRNSMFMHNVVRCPQCGGDAAIEDVAIDGEGNVHFIRRAYSILNDAAVARSDLEQFREVLEAARSGNISTEEATRRAQSINPSFRELLVPKTAGDFWQLIGVVLAVVLFLLQCSSEETPALNQTIINNIQLDLTRFVDTRFMLLAGGESGPARTRGVTHSQGRSAAASDYTSPQ